MTESLSARAARNPPRHLWISLSLMEGGLSCTTGRECAYTHHQHYYISSCLSASNPSTITPAELPGKGVLYHRAELPGVVVPNIKGYLEQRLLLFLDEPPPPSIPTWSKPVIQFSYI